MMQNRPYAGQMAQPMPQQGGNPYAPMVPPQAMPMDGSQPDQRAMIANLLMQQGAGGQMPGAQQSMPGMQSPSDQELNRIMMMRQQAEQAMQAQQQPQMPGIMGAPVR